VNGRETTSSFSWFLLCLKKQGFVQLSKQTEFQQRHLTASPISPPNWNKLEGFEFSLTTKPRGIISILQKPERQAGRPNSVCSVMHSVSTDWKET